MGKSKRGRRRGGRAKGYYYRKGRGWYAVDGKRSVPLTDLNGGSIQEKDTSPAELKQAYHRWQTAQAAREAVEFATMTQAASATNVTLVEVCDA